MAFLSTLIGKPVADVNGEPVGHLDDLIASMRGDLPRPKVVAVVIRRRGQPLDRADLGGGRAHRAGRSAHPGGR